MKNTIALLLLGATSLLQALAADAPFANWKLKADSAALKWQEAYPVGNGSMGAMNMGSYPEERIFLNLDTIWTSPARHKLKPDDRVKGMDETFELCVEGKYGEANTAYARTKNRGNSIAGFQGLGELKITHLASAETEKKRSSTQRELDLLSGQSTTITTTQHGQLTQTLLASYPDPCIAIRLDSTAPKGLQCKFELSREAGVTQIESKNGVISFEADSGEAATKFSALVHVIPGHGGYIKSIDDTLVLNGGKSAVVLIAMGSNYNRVEPRSPRTDWLDAVAQDLKKVSALGWDKLQMRAAADHANLMRGCVLDLGSSGMAINDMTLADRMQRVRKGEYDPDLIELFFQMGRHMLVSSSRPGSLPPNLQGLWEPGLRAVWNGDFHLNINVQMNMWPAEVTGLGECNEPFFALIKLMHKYGQDTARSLGCRGYCAGLNTDAWGHSDWSGGSLEWDSFMLGGHWAQAHLMETYRYRGDEKFLQETIWPVLKDSSLYMIDWLREHPEQKGMLIASPSASAENVFVFKDSKGNKKRGNVSIGNTFDHSIARETFLDTLECAQVLGIDDRFTKEVATTLKRVPMPEISEDGRIMEWWKPFGEVWEAHRHKSHLYALYPGRQISTVSTPELAKAAHASMVVRMDSSGGDAGGGGFTGWNLAWAVNLWARLQEGDRSLAAIQQQLATQCNGNLFNRCGPHYQIDGNLGTPAGIVEMLMQSHEKARNGEMVLRLLPALPKKWDEGNVTGLHARGGFLVDISWSKRKLKKATITHPIGASLQVCFNGKIKKITVPAGKMVTLF